MYALSIVVHLSDLHFGREDRDVVDALIAQIQQIQPQVIAVSGDFTQRARRGQFRRARAFLDALPFPALVVPGNHDVPLFNVFARMFDPLGGYRRHITTDLTPAFSDDTVVLVGMDTTKPASVKQAKVHAHDVARICAYVQPFAESVVRILVAHHPFEPGAGSALEGLTHGGIDVFLTGHLHVSSAGHTASRHNVAGRSALVVEAGTATSTRLRGETNAFNVLTVESTAIVVERFEWQLPAFRSAEIQRFRRTEAGWASL